MVCGKLPIEGNSMAQLTFRIANEPHAVQAGSEIVEAVCSQFVVKESSGSRI